ncbi:response regulator transcription factor [Tessaracoccus sp. HDW20]|uniref:response regulator transcription factor n=1 Tax=Tessaracoccus coleopterorum TaxID=2714950 RepID=UPI0018D30D14|nr:response regulator transcription factor [Tessaracoccus coleopterorum]NHB86046.1 response regulator transcription factor [Tessaracoccus coleopterorum]
MRVFLAEDQFLLRQGLENLLRSNGVEIVGSRPDGDGLPDLLASSGADLALLDIRMPPTNTDEGIRAALELRRRRPGFPVVLLSQYVEHLYLDELLGDGGGAVGYLLKDRVFDDVSFVASLRTVAAGGTVVDPEVITSLMQRQVLTSRLSALTARETEVLARMAEGEANASIALRLVVTEKAVQKHINAIFTKLDLSEEPNSARRVLAVLAFLRGR